MTFIYLLVTSDYHFLHFFHVLIHHDIQLLARDILHLLPFHSHEREYKSHRIPWNGDFKLTLYVRHDSDTCSLDQHGYTRKRFASPVFHRTGYRFTLLFLVIIIFIRDVDDVLFEKIP